MLPVTPEAPNIPVAPEAPIQPTAPSRLTTQPVTLDAVPTALVTMTSIKEPYAPVTSATI